MWQNGQEEGALVCWMDLLHACEVSTCAAKYCMLGGACTTMSELHCECVGRVGL